MHRNVAQTKSDKELRKTEEVFDKIKNSTIVYCNPDKCRAFNNGVCALKDLFVNSSSICEFDSQNSNGKER